MKNGFYLITGTSKGIGEAMAQRILREANNTVLGISRNQPDSIKSDNFHHLLFDLTDTSRTSQIMDKTNEIVDKQNFEFICLVNNASATEPIGSIEKCPPSEIESHVKIGLLAPMIIVRSSFYSSG